MKTIFVTGATGNQGGAVAASLINKGFKIKVLTRKIDSIKAQNLQNSNVELIKGDLNDLNTYRKHLKDVDGIFSVQTFENGVEKEIKQGIGLANLAKEYGVNHFLYSSVAGADLNTGIPHFDSKYKIENYIKQLSLPYTILRPNSLFENFLIPQVKGRILKGKLASPINKNKTQQFISAVDIGEISSDIFLNKSKYLGKTITIGTEEMDMQQVANAFSEVLGKEISYQKFPMLIARLVMGKDLYKMFKWINENDAVFMKDLELFKKENPNLLSLNQWIKLNFKNN
ncbi:MAG: NmrA/HSCARG family protein [Bacteroidetes bacterium]|nr:NmrA/HSCARG family protein [Bacteroidota bacterium]MBU1373773.1 NmrA/HSCARG family protein [Bacteroidota bacterium]MBU1485944.1 NmrA/HSCARG family protein [Bacteroidota bacterium]MBU1759812.1 NmrA/HSCARG family protein [Bacteroidota bacterium]MBU2268752.1 NmrA/HSCARG family protein [Bacteroidota bacterium]